MFTCVVVIHATKVTFTKSNDQKTICSRPYSQLDNLGGGNIRVLHEEIVLKFVGFFYFCV